MLFNHTHPFNGHCLEIPRWAGTRKVKPVWILLKQETVSGSGISWAICKSAHYSKHPTTQFFYRPDALPAAQPTVSKHWRHMLLNQFTHYLFRLPAGTAGTQSSRRQRGCGSMEPQHGVQDRMRAVPCLQPKDVAEYRLAIYRAVVGGLASPAMAWPFFRHENFFYHSLPKS